MPSSNLLWSKTGHITHVPTPSRDIGQKTSYLRHASEATCRLGMGAGAKTLRTAALSLVYSTAEYCIPVWCRSAHTRPIAIILNDALRIVTGCPRPTPTGHLPIFSGIQPAELRRLGATLSLAKRSNLDPDHILRGQLAGLLDVLRERLTSRRPYAPAEQKLINDQCELGIREAQWTNIDRAQSILNAYLYSMFSFPGPLLGHLEWTCPEHLWSSSIACGLALGVFTRPCTNGVSLPHQIASVAPPIKPQTTLSQRTSYIGHLEGWLVWRFWMTILDAGLTPSQPASDSIDFSLHTKKIFS